MTGDEMNGDASNEPPRKPASPSDEAAERIKRELDFGVGYMRPPRHTRFKKGQSGNPKGRPKVSDIGQGRSRSASSLVLREAERMTTLKDARGIRQVPAIEAVLRAQIASAAKGNAYAQRHFIDRYERAERERSREIQKEIAIWKFYIAQCQKEMEDAAQRGEPPPSPLPHPDDVVIDEEKGVRFIGPITEEDVIRLQETLKLQNVLIMQNELDSREAGDTDNGDPLDGPGTAMLFMHLINLSIPARYRLSDAAIIRRMMDYRVMPKRALLKTLYRAWRAIGMQVPRGRTLPSMRVGKEWAEFTVDLVKRWKDGRLDVENSTPQELEAAIAEVFREWRQGVDPVL